VVRDHLRDDLFEHLLVPSLEGAVALSEAHRVAVLVGDDLKLQIDRLAWGRGWRAACVLTCAGSLSNAEIRFADQADIGHVDGPLEIISLSGTIASFGGSHLHIAVANSKGQVIGGHLKEGSLVRTTAEIVIGVLEGYAFHREIDPETGYAELVINQG
jgi:predicted DNA-binding protein with PD1-like motif